MKIPTMLCTLECSSSPPLKFSQQESQNKQFIVVAYIEKLVAFVHVTKVGELYTHVHCVGSSYSIREKKYTQEDLLLSLAPPAEFLVIEFRQSLNWNEMF